MKRPGDDVVEEQGAEKRPRSSGRRHQQLLLVAGDSVSLLIGKGGATIRDMEAQSGATISFSKEDVLMLGEALRIVTVGGETLEAIANAACVIAQTEIDVRQEEPGGRPRLRLLVQNEMVGSLIGARGSGIRAITQGGDVFLSFCKEHEMPPGSAVRLVTMAGALEEVHQCVLRLSEKHEALLQEKYGDGPGPPAPGAPGRPEPPWVPVKAEAWVPVNAEWPPPPPAPMALAWSAPPIGARRQVFNSSGGRENFGWGPPGGSGGGDFRGLPVPPHLGHSGGGQPSQGGPGAGPEISMTLWIPDEQVKHFIGKSGSSIKRITESTRVYVSVDKEDATKSLGDVAGEQPLRPVILRGPLEAVLRAQEMAMRLLLDCDASISFTMVAAAGEAGQAPEH